MPWKFKSDRPIYAQLIEQIELKICSGEYSPGSKLPSVRELAQEISVNPNTLQRAFAKLEEDGLLFTNRTSGRFVTEDMNMICSIKSKIAKEHVQQFLENMKKLGFETAEIIKMLKTMLEEMKK